MNKNEQISIRRACKQDFKEVLLMVRELASLEGGDCVFKKKDFLEAGFGANRYFTMLVAAHKKRCVGYITFHPGYDMQSASKGLYLIDIFVKESYRRKKVAGLLMSAAAEVSTRTGGTWLSWHVSPRNAHAIAFYEQLGAKETDSLQYVLDV